MSNATTEKELASVEAEVKQGTGSYTHTFSKPFTYEGKTYERLTFDFDKLTGNDCLAI